MFSFPPRFPFKLNDHFCFFAFSFPFSPCTLVFFLFRYLFVLFLFVRCCFFPFLSCLFWPWSMPSLSSSSVTSFPKWTGRLRMQMRSSMERCQLLATCLHKIMLRTWKMHWTRYADREERRGERNEPLLPSYFAFLCALSSFFVAFLLFRKM